jgi:hypothetical protein
MRDLSRRRGKRKSEALNLKHEIQNEDIEPRINAKFEEKESFTAKAQRSLRNAEKMH